MPRPPMNAEQRTAADAARRSAVLVGLAQSIAEKGYVATTIADIAAAGRVSKGAVYEYFADKEEVLLALYAAANEHVIEVVRAADRAARADGDGWPDRIRRALRSYLEAMRDGGPLTRCLLAEAPAVSAAAQRVRRAAITDYVDELLAIAEDIVAEAPKLTRPTRISVMLLVGGLHELMLDALETGAGWDVEAITEAGASVAVSTLGAQPRA